MRAFIGGVLAGVGIAVVVVVVAVVIFDLRIEKGSATDGGSPGAQLTAEEKDELFKGQEAILVYCTEDGGPRASVNYSTALDFLIGVARAQPLAPAEVNVFDAALTGGSFPTMRQYLLDDADLIRRKCSEQRGLGDDERWESDVERLQEVAAQLVAETSG